jgi:hypothetical protein
MNKRTFLKTSLAATGTSLLAAEGAGADFYELRQYSLKTAKQPLLDDYLGKAFIPAIARLGSGPVGVFTEPVGADDVAVFVLIVHPSAEKVATLSTRLAADAAYQKSAAAYLAAVAADPVYARIESSLLRGIAGMPKLAKPDASKPRLLNLRIYESHNERAAAKKIEMFNQHELAIFRRVGLTPVFFGETLLGSRMPNLTYMLVFPDGEGRKQAWSRFGGDADWKALKAIPEYADKEIVSKITNKLLTPTAYSQI